MEIATPATWIWMLTNETVTALAGTTTASVRGWRATERWPINGGSRKTDAAEMIVVVAWMTDMTADVEALKTFETLDFLLVRSRHLVVAVSLLFTKLHRDADRLNLARTRQKPSWKRSTLKLALYSCLSLLLLSPPGISDYFSRTSWEGVV